MGSQISVILTLWAENRQFFSGDIHDVSYIMLKLIISWVQNSFSFSEQCSGWGVIAVFPARTPKISIWPRNRLLVDTSREYPEYVNLKAFRFEFERPWHRWPIEREFERPWHRWPIAIWQVKPPFQITLLNEEPPHVNTALVAFLTWIR